jgi:hypothetical protein
MSSHGYVQRNNNKHERIINFANIGGTKYEVLVFSYWVLISSISLKKILGTIK